MIAAVIGDIVSAMPDDERRTARASTYQYDVCERRGRGTAAGRRAIEHMPNATVRLAPKRALSRGVSGATMIMIGAIGRNRSAAAERRCSRARAGSTA